jgi:hypothetical protein
MYKRSITFFDLDGDVRTQDFWFNLTMPEVTELELEMPGGMSNYWISMVDNKDAKNMLKSFKDLIAMSYGERLDDGITFLKEDPITGRPLGRRFLQTFAYAALFLELLGPKATSNDFVEFLRAVMPAELAEAMPKDLENVQLPPTQSVLQAVPAEKTEIEHYTRKEQLEMSQEKFDELAGTDPQKWTHPVMQVAFQRKTLADAKANPEG